MRKMLEHIWKRGFYEDPPAPEGGGGGGGAPPPADTGAGGGEEAGGGGAPPPAGAPPADATATEMARLKEENQKLTDRWNKASQVVEEDPNTGGIRIKMPALPDLDRQQQKTPEEIEREQREAAITEQSAQLAETVRFTEETVAARFKASDALFEENFKLAREKMMRLPMANRADPKSWEKAYNMARGENLAKHEQWARQDERNKVLAEVKKNGGASVTVGDQSHAGEGAERFDPSKMTLTPEQKEACQKMIRAGLLKNEDEYKENMFFLNGGAQ